MGLFVRLVRALYVFGLIFMSYMSQLALTRITEEWTKDPATGREVQRLPGWVERRRQRIDERNADRLLGGMLSLRGVYIKLGQVLSIMGGFLPRVYTKRLEQLQDAVPPRPYAEIAEGFFESVGDTPERAFVEFDRTPLAAASLGQVHIAWLKPAVGAAEARGAKVAVKVLYPGIRDVIRVDMQVIRLAVLVYSWFVPMRGIERVHEALDDLLVRETDYVHEARCMERMAANFSKEKDILFPEVVWPLTTKDVLTMTFMEGTKIGKVDELRAQNIDPSAVATRFVESFYKQIFLDRFFHADPHPGNFLVLPGRTPRRPKLVVLDFGAISEVPTHLVEGLFDVISGVVEGNERRLLEGFFHMGFAARGSENRELLERTVRVYFEKLLRVKERTAGALMRANQKELEALVDPEVAREELRDLMKAFEYPVGWFYLERAVVMSFWLCAQLDPDLDTMQVGYPYIMPLLQEHRAKRRASELPPPPPPGEEGDELAESTPGDAAAEPNGAASESARTDAASREGEAPPP